MNPIDAVRLALEVRRPCPDELRALAERCVAVGEDDVAEVARGFARLGEVWNHATPSGTQKKVDTPPPRAHGR